MLSVEMDGQEAQRVTAPTGPIGFWAAVTVNTVVAVAFWVSLSHRYGYDGVGYYYEAWLWPVAMFLAVAVVSGFVALAVSGWRRFGVGLIAGAITVALADLAWTFLYLVSEGS